jgi:hypothetical protein
VNEKHEPRTQEQSNSVFGQVDQNSIASKIEQTQHDDEDSIFFAQRREVETTTAAHIFDRGVQALTGEILNSATPRLQSSDHHGSSQSGQTPQIIQVRFTEVIPAHPSARRAFLLYGPAGVCR